MAGAGAVSGAPMRGSETRTKPHIRPQRIVVASQHRRKAPCCSRWNKGWQRRPRRAGNAFQPVKESASDAPLVCAACQLQSRNSVASQQHRGGHVRAREDIARSSLHAEGTLRPGLVFAGLVPNLCVCRVCTSYAWSGGLWRAAVRPWTTIRIGTRSTAQWSRLLWVC